MFASLIMTSSRDYMIMSMHNHILYIMKCIYHIKKDPLQLFIIKVLGILYENSNATVQQLHFGCLLIILQMDTGCLLLFLKMDTTPVIFFYKWLFSSDSKYEGKHRQQYNSSQPWGILNLVVFSFLSQRVCPDFAVKNITLVVGQWVVCQQLIGL